MSHNRTRTRTGRRGRGSLAPPGRGVRVSLVGLVIGFSLLPAPCGPTQDVARTETAVAGTPTTAAATATTSTTGGATGTTGGATATTGTTSSTTATTGTTGGAPTEKSTVG